MNARSSRPDTISLYHLWFITQPRHGRSAVIRCDWLPGAWPVSQPADAVCQQLGLASEAAINFRGTYFLSAISYVNEHQMSAAFVTTDTTASTPTSTPSVQQTR